ncbi:MAG: amino acid ABC transporter substrate-binding protein [Alphaproteobacteria bacterium]|nr:amino acid ABC transporter substrate-binding protein [Alphaproteobacteria bacterium]
MKARYLFNIALLAFVFGMAGSWVGLRMVGSRPSTILSSSRESTYDRVMRAQTLRCGYVVWPPYIAKDPKTGAMSGIFYDYLEALGKALNLKIEWAEEIGMGEFPAALESGRIDAECDSTWPNASRARQIDFTIPIYYVAHHVYARADDDRFDGRLDRIDDPAVRIVSIDGEMAGLIAANDFPKAQTLQLAQLAGQADPFLNVAMGKADVYIADSATAAAFEAHNPGKIRRVLSSSPLRVFGNTIAVAQGQEKFRRMLNAATQELLDSGRLEKILQKYEKIPGSLLRVAPHYMGKTDF